MVLKLLKIASFLQFFADASKKSKAALAIYVYASESSPMRSQIALIDLYYLLRLAQICKKCTNLGNLRTIT